MKTGTNHNTLDHLKAFKPTKKDTKMGSTSKPLYQVAVLMFNGVDILDFAGPVEMLSHISYNHNPDTPEHVFQFQLVANSTTVRSGGCITVNSDLTFEEATKQIDTFDILIVPGGLPSVIKNLYETHAAELKFIEAFSNAAPAKEGRERVIMSVCTGALLLGSTGALSGLTATTHHRALDILRNVCQNASKGVEGAKPVEVVSKRYIDGGLNAAGIRVITSGGISCGLDASLYLGSLKTSVQAAEFVCKVSEYEWRRE